LNKADLVIGILLIVGAIAGYKRGFLLELFFLISIVLGVFLGFSLMSQGVEFLSDKFNADQSTLPYISFALIFVIVVVIVSIIGKSIKTILDQTFLGRLDSFAGAMLGIVKFAFGISVVIWLIDSLRIEIPGEWVDDSILYPMTAHVAPWVASLFGDFVPFFKETFKQF
jgi:membrane protein required for colicin V production